MDLYSESISDSGLKAVNSLEVPLAYLDVNLLCRFANKAMLAWFGKTREELVDKQNLRDLLGPLFDLNLPYINKVLTGVPQRFERAITTPNGATRHAMVHYYPDIEQGTVKGFTVHLNDITEQKQLQASLIATNALLYGLFEDSPAAISISNLEDGKWRDVNTKFVELFEFESKEEIIGKSAAESNVLNDPNQRREIIQLLKDHNVVKDYEISIKTKSGVDKWLSSSVTTITFDNTPCMLAVSIDITSKKEAEKKLQFSEEKYRSLINLSPAGIALSTIRGEILENNQAVLDILGYESNVEYKSKLAVEHFVNPEERKRLIDLFQKDAVVKNYEIQLKKKNGELVWISNYLMPFFMPDGEKVLLSTSLDITTFKNMMDQQLVQNEKINEQNDRLLNFSNIVSHNLKSYSYNLSSILTLYNEATEEEQKSKLFHYLQRISTGFSTTVNHLNEIVQSQNIAALPPVMINVHDYVEATKETLLVQIVTAQAEVLNQVPKDILLLANPSYMESILLNLMTNALKYRKEAEAPVIVLRCTQADGKTVFTIQDNGKGINLSKHGEDVFKMYKTFHGNKDAEGVGLYITKYQVQTMGGEITVDSEEGVGTTFTISFG